MIWIICNGQDPRDQRNHFTVGRSIAAEAGFLFVLLFSSILPLYPGDALAMVASGQRMPATAGSILSTARMPRSGQHGEPASFAASDLCLLPMSPTRSVGSGQRELHCRRNCSLIAPTCRDGLGLRICSRRMRGDQDGVTAPVDTCWFCAITILANWRTASRCRSGAQSPGGMFEPRLRLRRNCWLYLLVAWHKSFHATTGWPIPYLLACCCAVV